MTRQRKVILEEIRKTDSHPTADELYQRVRQRLPHVSLGTIYRNLETLAASGLIQKLEMGGSQKRFDGNLAAHHHVSCTACGHVTDVHIEPADGMDYSVLDAKGYDIAGHRVEFIGLCPECRESSK
jgi:Fur family ferric uptake transcriptional regulator